MPAYQTDLSNREWNIVDPYLSSPQKNEVDLDKIVMAPEMF